MDPQVSRKTALDDEDKVTISEVFFQAVVPKLRRLHARLGTLSCAFAGEEYSCWCIEFRSVGADFEIVDFEYDEDGAGLDLDL